ncbi:MAG: histidine--tRNA ligase [Bacilli bacterium]|nr:histidine--tRNA ligase [Bacilli bacterium]
MQKAKGTYDVFGEYGKKIRVVENILSDLMEVYDYEYFRTPIFEASEVFHRGVGDTTDIVTKETYDFKDRGDRDMTLRPEGTAGIVRSYIENKYYGNPNVPSKIWYYGPMFRYERPQSGRFREFYQFGVEVFGSNDPLTDAEVISIPVNFYKMLGLKQIKVHINSLGDTESRDNYRKALKDYFRPHLDSLCEDCHVRFEKNPLRILDCKVDKDLDVMKKAPKTIDFLNEESKSHFDKVKEYLDAMNIEYIEDPNLVRGLDYYTHTVFEVEASVEGFGAQNILCGGGRYNKLVGTLGGPDTPGVGFAMGMERLMTALDYEKINLIEEDGIDAYIIPMSENEKGYSIGICNALRLSGYRTDMDYMSRNIKSNFKQSERLNAKYVIIIGEEETKNNVLTIKDNETKDEYKVKVSELVDFLDSKFDAHECGCGHCHE